MDKKRIQVFIGLFIFLAAVLFVLDLMLGSVNIPFHDTLIALTGGTIKDSWHYILFELRLPRAINAILTGAGLATAGLLMQTLFRNPLAGPYVLGISSGASLGVALYVMSASIFSIDFLANTGLISSWGQVIAAVAGATLVFLLIISVATRVKDSVSLLIVGIMFGSLTSAVVSILQYFSKPELVQKFVIWTMGSLSATNWQQLMVMLPFVLFGTSIAIFLIKPLNALLLGEKNARATGVNMRSVRFMILASTGISAGALTAFNGPIAFVGLAVPHLVRISTNSSNHRVLLPGSIVMGAALLLLCDIISQVPGKSMILPINAVTALFGAPVVIWIIMGKKKLRNSF